MFDVIALNSTLGALKNIGEGSPNRLLYQPFNEGYDYVAEDTSVLAILKVSCWNPYLRQILGTINTQILVFE